MDGWGGLGVVRREGERRVIVFFLGWLFYLYFLRVFEIINMRCYFCFFSGDFI